MRLQTKIISSTVAIFIIVNFAFVFNYIVSKRSDLYNKLEKKIEKNNWLIKQIIAEPLFLYNTELVEKNLKSFSNDPDISSVYLIETNKVLELYLENPDINRGKLIEDVIELVFNGELIGKVIINYTRYSINIELRSSIIRIILSVTIITLLISMTQYLLLGVIIKPVKKLTEISMEISNGGLNREIDIHTNDEIGLLSQSFESMRSSIKEKIEQLQIENSQRKKAEVKLSKVNEELKEHKMNLEALVNVRTAALEQSLNELKITQKKLVESETLASLGELVAGVAHEINTPVGISLTASSFINDESKRITESFNSKKITRKELKEFIKTCLDSSEIIKSTMLKSAKLIQSFKGIALSQSKDDIQICNISEYIEAITELHKHRLKDKKINLTLVCPPDLEIKIYPRVLSIIINNLLMNSIQHGYTGTESGNVEIVVSSSSDIIKIVYRDDGAGIDKESQDKIFAPFYTTKRGEGRVGLGLNTVYNLITKNLQGDITYNSSDRNGVKFTITFPCEI